MGLHSRHPIPVRRAVLAWARTCLNIHSRHLYVPLCSIFGPNSGYIARYAPFIWPKSPTKWDAHLTESNFQTRPRTCFVLKAQSCFGHHISCDAYQAAQGMGKYGNRVFLGKGPFYGEFVDKSGKAFYNALNASRGLLVKPLFKIREDMDYGRS